jgi:hypothetical protein
MLHFMHPIYLSHVRIPPLPELQTGRDPLRPSHTMVWRIEIYIRHVCIYICMPISHIVLVVSPSCYLADFKE